MRRVLRFRFSIPNIRERARARERTLTGCDVKNQRGVVYLEMLIGFLPVFLFFLGTLQVADASVAHLVIEHAATAAARATVVVMPDDGAYYNDEDNAHVDEFGDYRQSDIERAADTILAANPRLDSSFANTWPDKLKYADREVVTTTVTAPYRCLVPLFCPVELVMSASAQLIYQGAHYKYEPATGWASNAVNHGLDNIKKKVEERREKKKKQEEQQNGKQNPDQNTDPDDDDDGKDKGDKKDDGKHKGDKKDDDNDKGDKKDDGKDKGDDKAKHDDPKHGDGDDKAKDGSDEHDKGKDDDHKAKPKDDDQKLDPATQKKVDDLRKALPPKQRDIPIKVDPDLPGSTVRVHYTHDDKGRITGIEIHVGPGAQQRHIQDHVPTIKTMQRYQGAAGKARALVDKFRSWLTGNPNAGPGTLAWETHREVEKLSGIIEDRAKRLEDPNLSDADRRELERELTGYEKQLADYQKTLADITDEPGRGYVAANSEGRTGRQEAEHRYGKDVPDPPDGYHWSLDPAGNPIVVRDRVADANGNPVPPREFDPDAEADPNNPLAQFPERTKPTALPPHYRTDENALNGEFPPKRPDGTRESVNDIPGVEKAASARKDAKDAKDVAKAQLDAAAKKAGIKDDLTKSDGADILAKAKAQAQSSGDKAKVKAIEAAESARETYKKEQYNQQLASEQLGNAMAKGYMAEEHPDYTRVYPPEGKDEGPGKPGEFDYVYAKGDPPSIIIVEAKGAGATLGTAAGGTVSQGTPEYAQHIAQQMLAKETDPEMAAYWQAIAQGGPDAPEIRYIKVQAPVTTNGEARPGQISEFDLDPSPTPDPSTNP